MNEAVLGPLMEEEGITSRMEVIANLALENFPHILKEIKKVMKKVVKFDLQTNLKRTYLKGF